VTTPVSDVMRSEILGTLRRIEKDENVAILFAIESGSRAWGFHSPDSDYDVRFIYARPINWHLSIAPGRDVIERPISDELDISGWDLRKTLGLILRSNAVALEWLRSPITYLEVERFRRSLTEFAEATLSRRPMLWHYLRLAERQSERLLDDTGRVRLKPFFYTLRPALTLRWLRMHPASSAPPMNMTALMQDVDLSSSETDALIALTEAKKAAREAGTYGKAPPQLVSLIDTELDAARSELAGAKAPPRENAIHAADALHCDWTRFADAEIKEHV